MTLKMNSKNWMLAAGAAFLAVGAFAPAAMGADHRDSFAVDSEIEGDYTDAFGWPDPDRPGNIILAGMVNPFATPGLTTSYRFSAPFLYQIQIDNNQANGPAADLVMQVEFAGVSNRASNQPYRVLLGPATGSAITTRLVEGAPGVTNLCAQPLNAPFTTNGQPTAFTGAATSAASSPGAARLGTDVQDNYIFDNGTVKCYAGIADDSFITDATQAILRIGLNANARSRTVQSLRTGMTAPAAFTTGSDNQSNHTQDLFRGITGDIIGGLRGRPVQLNGRSGIDTFGGFNGSLFAVSIPGSLLRGPGIPDQSLGGAINGNLIGTWGTVSRPASTAFNGYQQTATGPWHQFERMGQQITATVFVFQQPMLQVSAQYPNGVYPHLVPADFEGTGVTVPASSNPISTATLKDLHNATGPEHDFRLWDRMYLDSLTPTPAGANNSGGGLLGGLLGGLSNLLIGGGNTVQARQAILTVLGFNSFGINGVPLYQGQFASLSQNQNRRLQAQLALPDYLRINLNTTFDSAPGAARPGAAAANNNSPTLALHQWGLQNGRRPADDVTDIVIRITRETADVKFPDTLVLPGIANVVPGSGPRWTPPSAAFPNGFARRAVNCEELNVAGGILNGGLIGNLINGGVAGLLRPGESDGLLGRLSLNVLTPCEDSRVFLVLQGTDWIEPAGDVANVATQNSEQQHLRNTFPYIGFNPLHGEAGDNGFGPTNP